ncbi:hypothetical protein LZ30DRAFT_706683, partial [Colletotrichum cereale]
MVRGMSWFAFLGWTRYLGGCLGPSVDLGLVHGLIVHALIVHSLMRDFTVEVGCNMAKYNSKTRPDRGRVGCLSVWWMWCVQVSCGVI